MFLGRVVEPGEPAWLPEDRAWAMALLAEERNTHEACGQPIDEAFDPSTWGRYTVDEGVKCNACLAIEAKSRRQDGSYEDGLHFTVRLRPEGAGHG